jgi:serine/threonine protein kinase
VVVQREGHAVKFPLNYGTADCSQASDEQWEIAADMAFESVEHEKDVYRRLGNYDGIVSCLDSSGAGIQMALMTYGKLRDYLPQDSISKSVRLAWLRDMARTLVYTHDRPLIFADVATRNFLLDNHLSVKLSDFTESSILPLTADMQTVNDNGYSIFTDIGQLGAVMYEVVTWKACGFDLFRNLPPGPATATWPRREDLPSTENIWLGHVMEKCWERGALRNTRDLSAVLDSVTLDD